MRSLLSSKVLFFLVATAVILGLNLTPLVAQYRHAPPGRTFTLINNNTQDYYFYLSLMNEGANGAASTYDPYTSEPHQPSVIFSYFLWLGKISKTLGISYALMYHLMRNFLGFLLLLTAYCLLLFLKIPYPRLTYFFFLFAAPFMHTINDYGTLRSVPFMSWWNGVDPIRRAAFLPHHMAGGLLLVLSVMIIFKFIDKPKWKYFGMLVLASAIMAFIHTPSLMILLLILPVTICIYTLVLTRGGTKEGSQTEMYRSLGYLSDRTPKLILYWLFGLVLLVFMVSQTKNGFPWSQYIDWEKNLQFPLERELLGAMGILFPFSLIGIYSALRSKKFEKVFIMCWLVVPFLFIPIAPKLNLSNIRLIQGVPYLPLAILAVLGIDIFAKHYEIFVDRIRNRIPKLWFVETLIKTADNLWTTLSRNTDILRTRKFHMRAKIVWIIFLLLFLIYTIPTISWSLKDQIREYWPIYGNVYLDNRLFDAFSFINNNYPAKTVILSTFYSGNYLPAYTNTVSFIGHFGYTYNEQAKEKETLKFFKGEMSAEEAKSFLLSNKIELVFAGPEEKPLSSTYLYPSVLKPVYNKDPVTIYKLIDF